MYIMYVLCVLNIEEPSFWCYLEHYHYKLTHNIVNF